MVDMADHDFGNDSPSARDERDGADGLLSQLSIIEDQGLESRADKYLQLHDRLRAQLEGGDVEFGSEVR